MVRAHNKWVLVLGMHRSGTSVITRSLLALGVELGSHLMESVPVVNEKGFWEDMDIYRLNDEMLYFLGTDWYCSTPILNSQIQLLFDQDYLQRAVDLLRAKIGNASVFGFKDPRLCRLLSFWQNVLAVLGGPDVYVLALRNPASVADSLKSRDGIDRTHAYLMWLSHILVALMLTANRPRVIVEYDNMLRDPFSQLSRIACGLDLEIDEYKARCYVESFLDKRLRHQNRHVIDLRSDPDCPSIVRTLYQYLRRAAMDKLELDGESFKRAVGRWNSQLVKLRPVMECIDRFQTQSFVRR